MERRSSNHASPPSSSSLSSSSKPHKQSYQLSSASPSSSPLLLPPSSASPLDGRRSLPNRLIAFSAFLFALLFVVLFFYYNSDQLKFSSAATMAVTVEFPYRSDGPPVVIENIKLKTNDKLDIVLESPGGTGYSWTVEGVICDNTSDTSSSSSPRSYLEKNESQEIKKNLKRPEDMGWTITSPEKLLDTSPPTGKVGALQSFRSQASPSPSSPQKCYIVMLHAKSWDPDEDPRRSVVSVDLE